MGVTPTVERALVASGDREKTALPPPGAPRLFGARPQSKEVGRRSSITGCTATGEGLGGRLLVAALGELRRGRALIEPDLLVDAPQCPEDPSELDRPGRASRVVQRQ